MDQFLRNHNYQFSHDNTDNLNSHIMIKDIEFMVLKPVEKEILGLPCQPSGQDSVLPLQRALVPFLVGEEDPTFCMARPKRKREKKFPDPDGFLAKSKGKKKRKKHFPT